MTERTEPIDRAEAKVQVALWIEQERDEYATPKWEEENDALQEQNVRDGNWINFPFSYLQRCRIGLEHPAARQALGKNITSSMSLLERAVEIFGDMPMPGVSTTDGVIPWNREPEPDEGGSVEQQVSFSDEEILSMVANSIGFAVFAKEGDLVVTISDEESERTKAAAHDVLCLLHKIETGELLEQGLPDHYVYLDEIDSEEWDNYDAVSFQTGTGRVLAIRNDGQRSSTASALAEEANQRARTKKVLRNEPPRHKRGEGKRI